MKKILLVMIITTLITFGCSNETNNLSKCRDSHRSKFSGSAEKQYELCINEENMPIFVDPQEALKQLKEDFSLGLEAIQEEFELEELTHKTYRDYFIYGWQLTIGTDEEKEQGIIVTQFFDNYQNSFESINEEK